MQSDQQLVELIELAKQGSAAARESLYYASFKTVYFIATCLMHAQESANSLTRDVFITMFQQIRKLADAEAFDNWLNALIARTCVSYLKDTLSPYSEQEIESEYEPIDEIFLPANALYDPVRRVYTVKSILELPILERICVFFSHVLLLGTKQMQSISTLTVNTINNKLNDAYGAINLAAIDLQDQENLELESVVPVGLSTILLQEHESFLPDAAQISIIWEQICKEVAPAETKPASVAQEQPADPPATTAAEAPIPEPAPQQLPAAQPIYAQQAVFAQEPKKENHLWLIIVMLIVLLLIIGVIIYIIVTINAVSKATDFGGAITAVVQSIAHKY